MLTLRLSAFALLLFSLNTYASESVTIKSMTVIDSKIEQLYKDLDLFISFTESVAKARELLKISIRENFYPNKFNFQLGLRENLKKTETILFNMKFILSQFEKYNLDPQISGNLTSQELQFFRDTLNKNTKIYNLELKIFNLAKNLVHQE